MKRQRILIVGLGLASFSEKSFVENDVDLLIERLQETARELGKTQEEMKICELAYYDKQHIDYDRSKKRSRDKNPPFKTKDRRW